MKKALFSDGIDTEVRGLPARSGAHGGTARLFPTLPTILPTIRSFLRGQATKAGLGEQTTYDVVLAVCEACANSLRHTVSPQIRLTWRVLPYAVEVDVEDGGVFPSVVVDAEGVWSGEGVGIPLMVAMTDEVVIHQGTDAHPGTLVRLVKHLPAPP